MIYSFHKIRKINAIKQKKMHKNVWKSEIKTLLNKEQRDGETYKMIRDELRKRKEQ